jgi:hypothetical protein
MKLIIRKLLLAFSAIIFAITIASCLSDDNPELYSPAVTFEGFLDDGWIELPGHIGMPNTCTIDHDTIDIWCYNDTFKNTPTDMRDGRMLWIQIHPFTVDTICGFCTAHLRVRVSDYATGMSQYTYSVYPADTIQGSLYTITGDVVQLERRHGGRIDIGNINIPLHLEGHGGIATRIKDARIYGNVK